MAQLEHIEAIEKRLWSAADTLRANSNYASNEYFLPVMGLIFLRHAYSRYLAVKDEPLIARTLFRRGVIESWGRGTLKMVELMQQVGLPRSEIEDAGGCVTVRLRPSRYVPPQRVAHDLTERQQRVLAYLSDHPGRVAVRLIAAALGMADSPWTIREDLATLKTLGLVRGSGWGRGTRWTLENQ